MMICISMFNANNNTFQKEKRKRAENLERLEKYGSNGGQKLGQASDGGNVLMLCVQSLCLCLCLAWLLSGWTDCDLFCYKLSD